MNGVSRSVGRSVEDLQDALSVVSFQSHSHHDFQQNLRASLQSLAWQAATNNKSHDSVVRSYDFNVISKSFQAVQWKDILAHDDALISKKESFLDHSVNCIYQAFQQIPTVLKLFLDVIQDPTAWPLSCQIPVIQCLVNVVIDHGSKLSSRDRRKSYSQQFLRLYVTETLRRIPALHLDRVETTSCATIDLLFPKLDVTNLPSLSKIQMRLSWIKELMGEFPRRRINFVPCLCNILNALDSMETQQTNSSQPKMNLKKQRNTKPQLRMRSKSKPQNALGARAVDYLHGDMEDTEGFASCLRPRRPQHFSEHATFAQSAQKVLRSSLPVSTLDDDVDDAKRQVVRMKCMERLLSMNECILGAPVNTLSPRFFLHRLLDAASVDPTNSASICWCILVYVDEMQKEATPQNDKVNLSVLSTLLWDKREQNDFFVVLFFTLLSECRYFDNVEHLWAAMASFVKLVELASRVTDADEFDNDDLLPVTYRYSFALLLTRRGALLKSHQGFVQLSSKLSILFGEEKDWASKPSRQSSDQRILVLESLRAASILGVAWEEENDETDANAWDNDCPNVASMGDMMRHASNSCGSNYQRPHLWSTMSLTNGTPDHPEDEIDPPIPCNVFMNGDVYSHIFAYLGYKRVCQVRCVSKEWCQIADDNRIWHQLYQAKFPLLADDKEALNKDRPWKQFFQDMIFAESELRARQCRGTRSFAICRVVGCNFIGTTASIGKHQEKHFKEIARKEKMLLKRKVASESKPRKRRATAAKKRAAPPKRSNFKSIQKRQSAKCASSSVTAKSSASKHLLATNKGPPANNAQVS